MIIQYFFCPQNAIVTFKVEKTTNVDLTVANVNVKMDIQEFVVMLTSQYVRFFFLFGLRMNCIIYLKKTYKVTCSSINYL